ncbi:hypothetical protein [Herbidospora solisilvae]|uniref:hypothetical protein n=1 Tax=Herbidospora solisilvae TaxID=2696284 RepID=UPI0038B36841
MYNELCFGYRDEVFVILLINARELLLKAIVSKSGQRGAHVVVRVDADDVPALALDQSSAIGFLASDSQARTRSILADPGSRPLRVSSGLHRYTFAGTGVACPVGLTSGEA